MDKNTIIGIALMTLLAIGYFYFAPKPEPRQQETTELSQSEQVAEPQESQIKEDVPEPEDQRALLSPEETEGLNDLQRDSLTSSRLFDMYSDFGPLVKGQDQSVRITTDKLTVSLESKGGFIKAAYLNNHKTFDSLVLPVINHNPENQYYMEFVYRNRPIRTSDLYFTPSAESLTVKGEDSAQIVMRAAISPDKYIDQIYTFKGNAYDVGYRVEMVGIGKELKNSFYELFWLSHLPKTEQSTKIQRQKTTIAYAQGGDVSKLDMGEKPQEKFLQSSVDWFSYKSQFFSAAFVADKPFRSGNLRVITPADESVVRSMEASMYVDIKKSDAVRSGFSLIFAPNEYYTLRSYKIGLQKQMDLGWGPLSFINIGTTYVFKFLERYISSYGVIILIFAFLVKMLVFPMTYKSYVSMAKLRVVNGTDAMKSLDEKYKDDAQKLQVEKMAVYRKMGVSPFGGCLPMVLQYPILISMFFFFPQSVELRQKAFLWAHDLSTYDSVYDLGFTIPMYGDHISLFTILMAISIYVYTYFNQKSQPTTNNQLKYLPYFMPLIFIVFLNNYASGLSLYYFGANLISIIQTTGIRYFLDDDKLMAQMEDARKKKKGSGGDKKEKGRMERWVDKQQQKQRELMQSQRGAQSKNRGTKSNKKRK